MRPTCYLKTWEYLPMPSATARGFRGGALALLLVSVCVFFGGLARRVAAQDISFEMVRSAAAEGSGCLLDANGQVDITSLGPVELMEVHVTGLPPNTGFDFFVIQLPNKPFGLSWYQGDIQTDDFGEASQNFIGRFNAETFIVAPGSGPAPVVHEADADHNPETAPVHTFHLGLWFNCPFDAAAAGCPGDMTPFNGDHTAGVQILSTRNFPDDEGPLRQLVP